MTTVIASREWVAADSLITSDVLVTVDKLIRHPGRLFSGAGEWVDVLRLVEAIVSGADAVELNERDALEVVEVNADGVFLWDAALVRVPVLDETIALGSGAAYALGAIDAGADVMEALAIAARRDPATRGPFRLLMLNGQATA
jgi:hypothetical protein